MGVGKFSRKMGLATLLALCLGLSASVSAHGPGGQNTGTYGLRFWQTISPKEFATRYTEKAIKRFPSIPYRTCVEQLQNNPEEFVKQISVLFKPLSRLQNEIHRLLLPELRTIKKSEFLAPLLPHYLGWIAETSEFLENFKNYESITSVVSTAVYEADYWPHDGSYKEKTLGIHSVYFGKLFARFMNPIKVENAELSLVKNGVYFIPSSPNLRRQFELIYSSELGNHTIDKPEKIISVCERLSPQWMKDYVTKWFPHLYPIPPDDSDTGEEISPRY